MEQFPDAIEGDAAFYELLSRSPLYYEASRWEFDVVRSEISAGATVVDIGCGSGAFLRSLTTTSRRTGLDHNAGALRELVESDPCVEGLRETPADHARNRPGVYDVVTAFQILEHLERPDQLLASVRRLVHPDGNVYISVPNVRRAGRADFEPLDHPPHHLTRWDTTHLKALGEKHGLTLTVVRYEPPDESVRLDVLTGIAMRHLSRLPTAISDQAVRIFRRSADFDPVRHRLIASGFYERRQIFGHTLLAHFRVAGADPS